jgi:hypothetical protein
VDGKAAFNWLTHSTPFMPRKLISISTTSGGRREISFTAVPRPDIRPPGAGTSATDQRGKTGADALVVVPMATLICMSLITGASTAHFVWQATVCRYRIE